MGRRGQKIRVVGILEGLCLWVWDAWPVIAMVVVIFEFATRGH
jgi:hypothetical protein